MMLRPLILFLAVIVAFTGIFFFVEVEAKTPKVNKQSKAP